MCEELSTLTLMLQSGIIWSDVTTVFREQASDDGPGHAGLEA